MTAGFVLRKVGVAAALTKVFASFFCGVARVVTLGIAMAPDLGALKTAASLAFVTALG